MVSGVGCRVQDLGCRVQGSECRVQGSEFRLQASGFRLQSSGFRCPFLAIWNEGLGSVPDKPFFRSGDEDQDIRHGHPTCDAYRGIMSLPSTLFQRCVAPYCIAHRNTILVYRPPGGGVHVIRHGRLRGVGLISRQSANWVFSIGCFQATEIMSLGIGDSTGLGCEPDNSLIGRF